MILRFYTNPPTGIQYPYILFNIYNHKREITRLKLRSADWLQHCLIDSGVDKLFFYDKLTDYPTEYLSKYLSTARKLTELFPDAWITIPDYPDDYQHKLCWKDGKTNVDLTLQNIEKFITIDGINWLPVIQSEFLNLKRYQETCREVRMRYNPSRVAVGTVCKTNNIRFIIKCIQETRRRFPTAWIHAFGPTLKAIKFIQHEINSFDSTAYFMKPNPKLLGERQCKTQAERRRYFQYWMKRLAEIVGTPTLQPYLGLSNREQGGEGEEPHLGTPSKEGGSPMPPANLIK